MDIPEINYEHEFLCPNPVYYLVRFLEHETKVDILNAKTQAELNAIVKIFQKIPKLLRNLKASALSARFVIECINAGYPPHLLSFHSLRAGTLCRAVIFALLLGFLRLYLILMYLGKDLATVLTLMRIIAGWKSEAIQLIYLKQPLRAVLNASGVVLGCDDDVFETASQAGVIVLEALDPEAFHQITLLPPTGPRRHCDNRLLSEFLFKPWMADVAQQKATGSIDKYVIAPHCIGHLSGHWNLCFFRKFYEEMREKFPIETVQLRQDYLSHYPPEGSYVPPSSPPFAFQSSTRSFFSILLTDLEARKRSSTKRVS